MRLPILSLLFLVNVAVGCQNDTKQASDSQETQVVPVQEVSIDSTNEKISPLKDSFNNSNIDIKQKEDNPSKKPTPAQKKEVKKLSIDQEKKGPAITFSQPSYNFGRIAQGEKVLHEYAFTNGGSVPLIIKDAKASCGCTQPIYPFVPIEPGGQGKILVQFNSSGRLGRQAPTIMVSSNGEPSIVQLQLLGEVVTEQLQDSLQ